MSIDKNALIVPGHGTLFINDANAPLPPDPLSAFSLMGDAIAGWENIGHTSTQNFPAFTRDGGDATSLGTWLQDGVDTIYAAVDWGLTFNPLQVNKDVLDLGFNGWVDDDGGYVIPAANSGQEKGLVLYSTDGTGALLFWMPATNINITDAPTIDNANYFELPFAASIQPADASAIAPDPVKGPGIIKIYKQGIAATAPAIVEISPAGAGTGTLAQITGRGFTGATAVTFGGTAATAFTVVNDGLLIAELPAGDAGSVPVVVTNANGASAAYSYTRTA